MGIAVLLYNVGVLSVLLALAAQGTGGYSVLDVWYDSSKGALVWGEHRATKETTRFGGDNRFSKLIKGELTRTKVEMMPSLIVDEDHFVTHHDYSDFVTVSTGERRYLSRSKESSVVGPSIFLIASDMVERATMKGGVFSTAIIERHIGRAADETSLEEAYGSLNGDVLAWVIHTRDSHRRLSWSVRGVRHSFGRPVRSVALAPSGAVLYVLEETPENTITVIEPESGATVSTIHPGGERLWKLFADQGSDCAVYLRRGLAPTVVVVSTRGETVREIRLPSE